MYQVLANCLLPTAEKFIIMFIDLLFQFYYYQCSVYLLRICSNALKNLSFPSSFIYTCSQVCVCVCVLFKRIILVWKFLLETSAALEFSHALWCSVSNTSVAVSCLCHMTNYNLLLHLLKLIKHWTCVTSRIAWSHIIWLILILENYSTMHTCCMTMWTSCVDGVYTTNSIIQGHNVSR